ncbi:hypothetical protein Pcinc_021737 [Petrolisthes cinctipes]|uniref:Uncharacterized protein n=1 Tax=Petrolisthes cinctipes TaxID=88211 RepID=A0AAE1FGT0_PETCI|nr:hypothetical protein Pcinc_021737 [Petrolisthes cinctipes]
MIISPYSVRPVCAKGQQEEYAGERGGRVRVECHLLAYPPSLVFTWAITRIPGGAPEPLESVGREEGLTGQYTLGRLEEEKVDVWCWGRNSVGLQYQPCKFTVYTRGKPGPVSGCEATNHTASGFTVTCLAGPGRSDHTTYTITVYTQNRYKGGVTGVREDHNTSRGGVQSQTSVEGASLQEVLVANLTRQSPHFSVGGLAGGGEFRVLVVARNREGSSAPVTLTTFTLNDNPQTVIQTTNPALPKSAIPNPANSNHANPNPANSNHADHIPALPNPPIPNPPIPNPANSSPTNSNPANSIHAIPNPALPNPTIPNFAIPNPAIPNPAIPNPIDPTLPSSTLPSPPLSKPPHDSLPDPVITPKPPSSP